jgi:hypothetical protein
MYTDPQATIFRGDSNPYESFVKTLPEPKPILLTPSPTPSVQRPEEIRDSGANPMKEQSVTSSTVQQVVLSEPKYSAGDYMSQMCSLEAEELRTQYEENFETALLQNFSLTNDWKTSSKTTHKGTQMQLKASAEISPIDAEPEETHLSSTGSNPSVDEDECMDFAQEYEPVSYTKKALSEYRIQV